MAFWFFSLLFFLIYSKSSAELIAALPGQPANVAFKQYSGYIATDSQHGRALFYYFVEAESADPLSLPLTLWLNGGPGCSSLGFGAFMEHGPFQPAENGLLLKNEYSWNLASNVLYVESPIGVGFSYSNTSSDYISWNDTTTAEDNLRFILNWLEEFPQYKDSEFFLTGESYAGHYIPQLATLLMEYNKQPNIKPIKLKAIALGNPLLDLDISVLSGDFMWSHGAISDKTLFLEKTVCNESKYLREIVHNQNVSEGCDDVFSRVAEEVSYDIDSGDLLLPMCLLPSSAQQFKPKGKLGQIHKMMAMRGTSNAGDPCIGDRIFAYLNKPQVQEALHANTTHLPFQWNFCGGPLDYQEENLEINIIPLISDLISEGIPILLFSGDQDTKIPLTQTRIIANKLAKELKLLPFTTYAPWYDHKQVGGWSQSFGAYKDGKNTTYLTYATVRGAAHEVPFTSPSQALTLFRAFLTGSPLPRPHDHN
ncbi:Carboxypeptidase [Melia azedarach]|uniref:Carboxypeptidase n=1 Tax=Melia azedarach TaxID=155640 RepID=A0ACC1X837_MELAZ|nr:Carboxypeptidase [Melia azedarach]